MKIRSRRSPSLCRAVPALVAVGVITLAIAGCGTAGQRPSSPIATHATATRTKTVTASSADHSLPTLVAKARSGIVRIRAIGCSGGDIGTGFILGPRLVATVDHVVAGATSITLLQGGRTVSTGTVIGEDSTRDVALVRTSTPLPGTVLQLATTAPALGEPVVALGFPLGLPLTSTQGAVSGVGRTVPIDGVRRRDMVQTDAAVNPGNSGGPLIDVDSGDVLGLVDLGNEEANGIAFAVSTQIARPLLQAWQQAPQRVPTAACTESTTVPDQDAAPTTTQAPPTTTTPGPGTSSYDGQAFSIAYPSTWQIQDAEKPTSYGTDTTFLSPADSTTLLRVDVTPHTTASTPQSAAAPVIAALETQPGYEQLDMSPETFDGFPALHWEFLVRESGVLLHKEDVSFIDTDNDTAVGVLTQAPAGEYPDLADSFAQLTNTLSMR
jgi:putative serine protease PepD